MGGGVGGVRLPPRPPGTSGTQRPPVRQRTVNPILAKCLPRCHQIAAGECCIFFPAWGALLFCWRHASPAPGCACAAPSLAEYSSCRSTNSPRRRRCCAWCHPVVSTAADTHSVKPSSGPPLPARHQLRSDFPRELEGVNSPCVSPILTMKLQLCAGCAWRRGSKPASFGATRPRPPHPTPHTEPNTLSGARPENP